MLNNLEKVKADACTEKTYRQILSLLMSEEIRQADIISHRTLATHLGMSKQPVGAALRRLEQEGRRELSSACRRVFRMPPPPCRTEANRHFSHQSKR